MKPPPCVTAWGRFFVRKERLDGAQKGPFVERKGLADFPLAATRRAACLHVRNAKVEACTNLTKPKV
jgi:hypothetical protein